MKHTPLIKATIAVTGLVTALTLGVLPANALTINFDLNGVAPVVHSESDPDSNKVTVPNLDLDFDNMTFTGWNTKANGRGETVEPGQTTKEDVLTNNDTITLYAQWADGTHLDIPGEYASLDDLTNVIASIAGTAIEGFNPLNNGGVWTIPHGSVVTLDVTKLLPENWSATYTQPDANTIVFTLTGLDKYGKELVVTYTFIVEPEVSGVASSTNPNAPSAGIGGELSNMSGSNNNSSTNQTTFTNTATTNSNPLANIHLAAPIAFILAGILASLAVLQLTKREVARANQVSTRTKTSTKTKANSNTKRSTTSHKAPSKSLPNLLTSYAKTIIHNKAYLSIATISAIAILGGSLYLTKGGVIEAASEGSSNTNTGRLDILDEINADGPKYQTMHSNNSITDTTYHNLTGDEYSGLVTVEDSLDKDLNGQTAWWYEGERQSGELSINKSWHYFDEDGYMVRDQAVTHNAKTSLAITDPDNTVDHDKDYTFRYDKDGKRIYGHQNIGGANFHFDEDTGIMTKGWGTLANGKTTYYALDNGAGVGGNMEHQLPISNGSTQTAWYYFDGEGVPVTNKWLTLSDSRLVYYLANGQQARGDQTVDGVQLHFNNSGVPDNGGWDFTDYQYVAKMRQRAIANGSDTDWYITLDCDYPPRDIVFRRVSGTWVAVAGYNAIQGYWREGGSRTIPGVHKVTHKYYESVSGPGRIIGFVANWLGGVVSPETDDSQAIHAGNDANNAGYGTYGCSSLSLEHDQWIYDNVPVDSTVDATGSCRGVDGDDRRIVSPYPNSDFNLDNHPYGQD